MIRRREHFSVLRALKAFPVVALLGPRQVGKTTLALAVAEEQKKHSLYLDLERDSDRNRLKEPELYLRAQTKRLVVIDEVQRQPELFALLRGIVDERIRAGEKGGQYLVLGSASRDLLRQSSESLAGRISYIELTPFSFDELAATNSPFDPDRLWLRGGFPASYLATDDSVSWDWRTNFISTYLERDLPQLGLRLPAEQLRRFWSMLAYGQGNLLNSARLAASLGVSGHTVRHYLDVLTDLYMIRQLQPWSGNSTKRLVRSPKIYVRDSGLLHRLAQISDFETLLGNPLCGESWEGFVIESLLAAMPDTWRASFYRSSAQAEADLVLEGPRQRVIVIEIKRTLSPALSPGFRAVCEETKATERYFVVPSGDRYPLGADTDALSLASVVTLLRKAWGGGRG